MNNTLGSTGLKPTSGDIDVAIDANRLSTQELIDLLLKWLEPQKMKPRDFIRRSGNCVHFRCPITGDASKGWVQVDFMFLSKPEFSKFILKSPANSDYQGRERNVLINSIAKSMGYKLNQNAGIMDRETNDLISDDWDEIAKMLLNKKATKDDLYSVETILQALEADPKRDKKLTDFKEHVTREGIPFVESKGESDVNFLARLRDRIVNQGMVALVESEQSPVNGGRAKGIEHIEDLVFRRGTRGIKEAIKTIAHLAENTEESTSVKWDGSPAIVFGRKEDGTFVLTDVSGYNAKGYDGLFTNTKMIENHLNKRDQDALANGKEAGRVANLLPTFQRIWPMLEEATPDKFRGFVQGDLLYTTTPPEEAGAFVFTPNTVTYRIPVESELGTKIANSEVGIAMHTKYAEHGAVKEPVDSLDFKEVPGLLLMDPVRPKGNVKPLEMEKLKELKVILRDMGDHIDTLFSPVELKSQQITDLPKLCIDYINSVIKDTDVDEFDADTLMTEFVAWLQTKVSPRKFKNIVEYLQVPRSNTDAFSAAFTTFVLLHDIKMDLLKQLDRQHPGQEGWVIATPYGTSKFINRFGFTRENAKH